MNTLFLAAVLVVMHAGAACAWEQQTHHTGADAIVKYLPQSMRTVISKNGDAFSKGIDEESELYDAVLQKHGRYERGLYVQDGITRLLFHIERIRFFLERPDKADSLAYTLGQFTRCAADLLEPQPEAGRFGPLEISATRMFLIADFQKNNPAFHILPDARVRIASFPAHLDELLKKSTRDGESIYRVYHTKRNYPSVDPEATAAFNRTLNFLINALTTLESMTRKESDMLLDVRNWLGIDSLRRYNNHDNKLKIEKPDAPSKPKSPSGPKVEK
jgi:hypothetical protein